ncbi:MAG: BatD family protein [Cyclobacteriaceae bacterium]
MIRTIRMLMSCVLGVVFFQVSQAQEVKVEMGPDKVATNQLWTITVTIQNERLKNYSPFPEIEGFVKRGTSSSTSTSYVNGQMSSSQSIIQNYQPTAEGIVTVPNFTMTINNAQFRIPGKKVTVGPPVQRQPQRDPFADFFNQRPSQPTEFIDVEADAFLALTTDKSEVYVGEGFTTTLAFYVSENNRADMRFYDLGNQITEIVKQIKPGSCWEENFNIDNINGEPVVIRGRSYTQYKIYQAAYFPLNVQQIDFPTVGLKLIKYKQAKNPGFFGRNRQEDFETFYSKSKTVAVKELPPHPLKESVAVGNYRLQEKISSEDLQTSQSFNYSFNIMGEGNISAIEPPGFPENKVFDIYEPDVRQNIRRASNAVTGTKSFDYYVIPNEPGKYELNDFFQWVFFNPDKDRYDTLSSRAVVNVEGESRQNEYISSSDLGSFYDGIEFEDNDLQPINQSSWVQILANLFIFAALIFSAVLVFKNK